MDTTTAPLPDAWRVEVFRRPPVDDPEANHLLGAVKELGIEGLSSARVGHGYLLPPALSPEEAGRIATELLADPVLDEITLYAPRQEPKKSSSARRVLVAKKAGVMDPVAMTITRALERNDLGGDQPEPYVSTFTAYELEGDASDNDIAEIAIA